MIINSRTIGLQGLGATPQQWLNQCMRTKGRRACTEARNRGMTIPPEVAAIAFGPTSPQAQAANSPATPGTTTTTTPAATTTTPAASTSTSPATSTPATTTAPAASTPAQAVATDPAAATVIDTVRKNNAKYRQVNQDLRRQVADAQAEIARLQTAPPTAANEDRIAQLETQLATVKKNNAKYREVNQQLRAQNAPVDDAAGPDPAASLTSDGTPRQNAGGAAGTSEDNTMLYVAGGVAAVALVGLALVLGGGKKKRKAAA